MRPCFLISLPRAGSTLLQRLMAQHPKIRTTGEPWMLLPFVYALRPKGSRAEYSHHSMSTGFREFVEGLPKGEDTYFREVGTMTERLHASRAGEGFDYFLDKTPRYHLILKELTRMFPEGRFVVLHRNPLAVVASILNTWTRGRFRLKSNALDVYEGPLSIHDFVMNAPTHLLEVHYESLAASPEATLRRVTEFLGLEPLARAELPNDDAVKRAALGDKRGIHQYRKVTTASVEAWPTSFASPIRRAWARRYLAYLGEARLQRMGYDVRELQGLLARGGFNGGQCARDLVDFNARLLPLLLAPSMTFQRVVRRKEVRLEYRYRWTSS